MKEYLEKLKRAKITIPKTTSTEKIDIIQTGLELFILDKEDVLKILNQNTSIKEAETILIDCRKSDEIKYLFPEIDDYEEYEFDL